MAEGGLPGERHIGYYRERALGGAGMIVVEPVPVHRTGVLTRGNFRHDDDAIIPAFRRVTDACREANPDIVMIHQLYHVGPARRRRQLVRAELVAVGPAVVSRRRRQPRDDRGRDRGAHRRLRRGRRPGAGERLRRRSRSSPPTTRVVDQFWTAVVEPADRSTGAARSRTGCASRRRSCGGSASACGEDFIIGLGGQRGSRVRRRCRPSRSWPGSSPGTTSDG